MENSKILFIVPDGVGIRNYLYSNLLSELKNSKIIILSSLPKEAFCQINFPFEYYKLNFAKEGFITRLFRETATYARLRYNAKKVSNNSILTNWNYKPKGLKLKILNKFAELTGKVISSNYQNILGFEKIAQNNWSKKSIEHYKKQLKEINPKTIFITHQRVASLMPICLAAKELNIPVISTIYSWDNLPKGRLAIKADKYVVWSEYMKAEMEQYYPEISLEDVLVTGTPQFEFYLQNNNIGKDEFAQKYNLDDTKPWICFSGDDIKTSPYDSEYLRDLAIAVSQINKNSQPQIIFRRCPIDFSNRYDNVINEFKDIIKPIDPIWNIPPDKNSWGAYFPKKEDIKLQASIVQYCKFVVNLGSTMAHDFASLNKPCFYINYDVSIAKNWSVKTIYKYQHFKSMKGYNAVGWFYSKNEIKEKVENALLNPNTIGVDKSKWLQKIVKHPLHLASIEIANVLSNDYE